MGWFGMTMGEVDEEWPTRFAWWVRNLNDDAWLSMIRLPHMTATKEAPAMTPADRRDLVIFTALVTLMVALIAYALVHAPDVDDVEPYIVTSTTIPAPR